MAEVVFPDRAAAGRALADRLAPYVGRPQMIVLALPRGGVPVAEQVARQLGASLDVFLVRKLGVPGHRELAMGAIASGGTVVLNEDVVTELRIPGGVVERVAAEEEAELHRREQVYRKSRPPLDVAGKTVIVVDDGLATGATMRSAVRALRHQGPARIVVAVPVAPPATCQELAEEADEVVCLSTPAGFYAVGAAYEDFRQVSDSEVVELLASL